MSFSTSLFLCAREITDHQIFYQIESSDGNFERKEKDMLWQLFSFAFVPNHA
jgi:hypothetical protein